MKNRSAGRSKFTEAQSSLLLSDQRQVFDWRKYAERWGLA